MEGRLAGYRFVRRLRSSGASQVWAGERESDGLAVVAKLFPIEDREGLEARVQHEFELIRRLDVPGVVRALALERSGRDLVLVLEAHAGVDLAEYLDGRALPLAEFFAIAVQLVAIVSEVHERHVVHRDIKPSNVLISPSGAVALADFGISVLMESERGRIHEREVAEGTLPYMAPEQTGRTARTVDQRSDLYSLGVTFHELLTGRRPFDARSPLELVHAQLAQRARPPRELRPELPEPLSRLIVKLLEKAPERRYQSARGLLADLIALRDAVLEGRELQDFELGRDDVSASLRLGDRLYGRSAERAQLLTHLHAASRGSPTLALIVGPTGAGKSALLDTLGEPVLEQRGFMARGKFEPDAERPFAGVLAALGALADMLLTESAEGLARWRTHLREGLGGFASVIVELVPRFALVLGPQPVDAGDELAPTELRNRAMLACARLLGLLALPAHPLVLALDDLHWADADSLELLGKLLGEPGRALLIVASTRGQGEELAQLVERMRGLGVVAQTIELGPLDPTSLSGLVADALGRPEPEVASLVEIVARKTASNPFFVRQFLLHLVELGLLERREGRWQWDPVRLDAAALPDDVLDMMARKLERLPPALRELIETASVFGSEFDPIALERVAQRGWLGGQLHALVDEGLIAPLPGRGYVFGHDRIREAAYAGIESARRKALHRMVGRELLGRLDEAERARRVFEIVDHLNRGHGLDPEQAERLPVHAAELAPSELVELAGLNLAAGQRALRSGAADSARAWLRVAECSFGLLEPSASHDELRRRSALALAQAESLTGEYASAETRLLALREGERRIDERGRLAKELVHVLVLADRIDDAIALSLAALAELGVSVPAKPGIAAIVRALVGMMRMVRPAAIERWRASPPMRDSAALVACELLNEINNIVYTLRPELFLVFTERFARLVARHGDHPAAARVFGQIGLVMAGGFGRRREGRALCERSLASGRERGHASKLYRAEQTLHYASLWFETAHASLEPLPRLFDLALEHGDLQQAAFVTTMHDVMCLHAGVHLRTVARLAEARASWLTQWGVAALGGAVELVVEVAHALLDGPLPDLDAPDPFRVARYESGGMGELRQLDAAAAAALALAVFGRWSAVARVLDGTFARLQRAVPGSWYQPSVMVLEGIASAVLLEHAREGKRRRRLRRTLRTRAAQLAAWTREGGNFEHVALLLQAELVAGEGRLLAALPLYRRAATLAAEQRNPWLEGLAWERLAARLCDHDELLGRAPLAQARACYLRWGAFNKVEALEREQPELAAAPAPEPSASNPTSTSSTTTSTALDTVSLLKTSSAIVEELQLEQVVERTLAIAVENAGAERGVLLLAEPEGVLRIMAETRTGEPSPLACPRVLDEHSELPASVLHWVEHTRESIASSDPSNDPRFAGDPYLRQLGGGSLLCLAIVKLGRLVGLLYLENRLGSGALTRERLDLLRIVSSQAASALDNARLYEDLRGSETRWRSLVEQLPDLVAQVDRKGRMVLGKPDALGLVELVEHDARVRAALEQVFESEQPERLELESRPGHWLLLRITPIARDGPLERVLVVATDISERKVTEQLQRQQQRLESIGTLASGVAHEINNPIQGIMNYAELIAGSSQADDEIREFAGEIEHETKRVSGIVRNLLAFSRQDPGAFEPASVPDIVQGTLSLVHAVLRKDQIAIEVAMPGELPVLHCRPQQIQQVIMNLVTNARDALNERYAAYHVDKRITIDASPFVREGKRWVALRVADHGGGIPDALVGRIFDPFFTTKPRERGTGLGLSVSHGIVQDHGGVLRLDNRPGEGATFVIELPV